LRNTFAKIITKLALKNRRIILMIGDTGSGLFDDFKKGAPDQFINAGIAEANMVTVAAGLARAGFIPFVYAIGPHLVYRAYEQIRNDICLNLINVKLISVGSGLHYADHGPTHHSTEDFVFESVAKHKNNFTIW
jgi:transketolase